MKKSTSVKLDLDIQFSTSSLEDKTLALVDELQLKKWVKSALRFNATITLRFTGQAESKKLNAYYREKNYATNVLTFVYEADPSKPNHLFADIVLCVPVIMAEAKAQKKTFPQHLAHLVVHGTLHAQGFDHDDDIEATAMEQLEAAILKKFKFPNPYQMD